MGNRQSAEIITLHPPTGEQTVSHYCADLIAAWEQKRFALAARVKPRLKALGSPVNLLDHQRHELEIELAMVWKTIRAKDDRQHVPPIRPWVYNTILVTMILLELPLSSAGFDFLDSTNIETTGLGLFFGCVNAVVAKITARTVRHGNINGRGWRELVIAGVLNAVLLVAIIGAAGLRSKLTGAGGVIFGALQATFYLAALLLSFQQIHACQVTEDLANRALALRKELNGIWKKRLPLAEEHDAALTKAEAQLRALEFDCIQRIEQWRDGYISHGGGEFAPFRQSVRPDVFVPIDLGRLLNDQPYTIQPSGFSTADEGGQ